MIGKIVDLTVVIVRTTVELALLLPTDYRRGVIDAHAVIINSRTNVIVDVAVLF
jgi:hypothetical protein